MASREVDFSVPDELYQECVRRFEAAGATDASELLETALLAGVIDTLQVIGGDGPIPTALSDVRAARLVEICKLRNELLSDEVVGVLFRVMLSTANGISRRMQATYESALESSLASHMRSSVKVSIPRKQENEASSYKLTFATSAAYSYAAKAIAVAGLTAEVTFPSSRTIQYPQEMAIRSEEKANLGVEILRLPADTDGFKKK